MDLCDGSAVVNSLFIVAPIVCVCDSCVRPLFCYLLAAKPLTSMRICTGLIEPPLLEMLAHIWPITVQSVKPSL